MYRNERLINRLSEIDSGSILFNGNDIMSHVPMEMRRKIGMIFQILLLDEQTSSLDAVMSENNICNYNI